MVVYFSLPEGSDPNNLNIEGENSTVVINGKVLGNTEYMAKIIQENIFFDSVDLSGKTVIPFGTHGGSGFAGTVETIKELEPKAKVSDNGRIISRNSIANSEKNIISWIESLGYKK